LTNREHLRRYQGTPFFDCIHKFVDTIDTKWYGGGNCRVEDYESCVSAHQTLRGLIRGRADVRRP
jgi:hypothetical protein